MKIVIIAVGRLKTGPEQEILRKTVTRFETRASSLGMTGLQILEIPESRAGSAPVRRAQEAKAILAKCKEEAPAVALCERGRAMTSTDFAKRLTSWRAENHRLLQFIIGGADGLADEVRCRAVFSLSLSQMTLTHGFARLLLCEQLYRAATILTGHPYHRA